MLADSPFHLPCSSSTSWTKKVKPFKIIRCTNNGGTYLILPISVAVNAEIVETVETGSACYNQQGFVAWSVGAPGS